MTPERWRVVDSVVQAALALTPTARGAYLDRACGSDAALRREAESLLAAAKTDEFLERPAVAAAASVVEGDQEQAGHSPPARLVEAL